MMAAANHAKPILARWRNVLGQRLDDERAPAAHEPKRENNVVLQIAGMTCSGCASHVEKVLREVPGVREAKVIYAEGTALVSGDGALDPSPFPSQLKPQAIKREFRSVAVRALSQTFRG